jgi:geranylgeranyl pyrophosphate synthase
MDFTAQLNAHVARVEHGLAMLVPAATARPARLHTAMRYSLEAGGKRLRPVLVLDAAELFAPSPQFPAFPAPLQAAVQHTPKLGKIIIEYRGNEDLQRLLEKLGVPA